jgi:hypothetical protein
LQVGSLTVVANQTIYYLQSLMLGQNELCLTDFTMLDFALQTTQHTILW